MIPRASLIICHINSFLLLLRVTTFPVRPPVVRRVQHGAGGRYSGLHDARPSGDDADSYDERVLHDVQQETLRCGRY